MYLPYYKSSFFFSHESDLRLAVGKNQNALSTALLRNSPANKNARMPTRSGRRYTAGEVITLELIPGLPNDIVLTHVLPHLYDPAEMACLCVTSRAMRDYVSEIVFWREPVFLGRSRNHKSVRGTAVERAAAERRLARRASR